MNGQTSAQPAVERCLRCSAAMEWRHGTWQCPRCRFKLGCCEGDSPEDFGRCVRAYFQSASGADAIPFDRVGSASVSMLGAYEATA